MTETTPPVSEPGDGSAAALLGDGLVPLAGGWSGRTFVSRLGDESVVVRIYPPGSRPPQVEAALLSLVRGLLPVPQVLEIRYGDDDQDLPGLLITEMLPGVRGDLLLPTLDDDRAAVAGRHLGALAADLSAIPMPRAGEFVDADLTVRSFGGQEQSLEAWVETHRGRLAEHGWTAAELEGLDRLAAAGEDLLIEVPRRCLVHSDLNPKNLLLDPDSLAVTGLVDWEYAHAGHPYTDLGNLLRFEPDGPYTSAVLAEFTARHGGDPGLARSLAAAADLWALVDLAARQGSNPVADAAAELLRGRARQCYE